MRDIIIDLQKPGPWKFQLKIAINFISFKDVDEDRAMHLKSGNTKFMTYDNVNFFVDELFESLLSRYQSGLETSMRESDFIFDSVQLLYCKCHKINFKRGGLYIESSNWMKNKKTAITPKNKDNECFQHVVTVALNYRKIESYPERLRILNCL